MEIIKIIIQVNQQKQTEKYRNKIKKYHVIVIVIVMGGGILPVAIKNNKLYFLFGKENELDDTPGWADFGGGAEESLQLQKLASKYTNVFSVLI